MLSWITLLQLGTILAFTPSQQHDGIIPPECRNSRMSAMTHQVNTTNKVPWEQTSGTRVLAWSKTSESCMDGDILQPSMEGLQEEISSQSFDLSSPREWLEFCEARKKKNIADFKDSFQDFGDPYTVIRCDFLGGAKQQWNVWGGNFHLQRLKHSVELLHGSGMLPLLPSEHEILAAVKASQDVMASLLMDSEHPAKSVVNAARNPHTSITFMLTLLWELVPSSDDPQRIEINVHGHAFSSLQPAVVQSKDNPNHAIQVSLGCFSDNNDALGLPNRFNNLPGAKLSSWCRRRYPLETLFKQEDIGEVILVRGSLRDDLESLELLEGLTSNLFVICMDGVIHTPPTNLVLGGFVRQLILDIAKTCGYSVQIGTLFLHDSSSWQEVFLTSSIRLIIPVSKILLPISKDTGGNGSAPTTKVVWEFSCTTEKTDRDLASNKLYQCLLEQNFAVPKDLWTK